MAASELFVGVLREEDGGTDEAKWPGLNRIFVDLTPSRRRACAVSIVDDNEETLFPVGTRARAHRPSQRNYLLRLAARRRPAAAGPAWSGPAAREPVTPRPLAARRDGQPCPTVGWSADRPGTRRAARVSDPFGDGSSSLDYICCAASSQRRP